MSRPELSPLGFGAAPIGNLYREVTESDALDAVDEAFKQGIRYFDTSPYYGFGLSESRLGRAFAGRARNTFAISTKVGRHIEADPSITGPLNDGFAVSGQRAMFDYSRDGVRRSFEGSLRRLGLDYVDVLLLHDVGSLTHGTRHPQVFKQALEEALPAMAELRAQGAVGSIGIGVNEQAVCLELMPRFDLDYIMLAGRYTLLEQSKSIEVMAEAQRRAVKIIVAGPYNSGLLANASAPGSTYDYHAADPGILERARRIYTECETEGVDIGAAALQLPLAAPVVVSVVAGQRTADEVKTAADRMRAAIPQSLWQRLRSVGLIEPTTPLP